jgi:hypothetical protein
MKDGSMIERLKNRIRAARGEISPALTVKGGRVINIFTREMRRTCRREGWRSNDNSSPPDCGTHVRPAS